MTSKEWVEYRGQRMVAGWPEKIQAAQDQRSYRLGGIEYERIPYGHEENDWGAGNTLKTQRERLEG